MTPIPRRYTLFFLYIEPASALVGAYYAAMQQQTYLSLTHAATAPQNGIPTSTTIILNQLSNLYFLFAINEVIVLRSTSDIDVWGALLFCLLVADIGHLFSVSAAGPQIYWNLAEWNAIDWGNVGFVYVGAAMRMSFLYNVWYKSSLHRSSSTLPIDPTTPYESTRKTARTIA